MSGIFRVTAGSNYDAISNADLADIGGLLSSRISGTSSLLVKENSGTMGYDNGSGFFYFLPNISSGYGGFYFDYSGGSAAAELHGGVFGDVLVGGSASDQLFGNDGADDLDGGSGGDTMVGGKGDDSFRVDDATDVVSENSDEGADIVYASIDYTLGNEVETLILQGSALTGKGSDFANTLIGTSAGNRLVGLGGDDTLYGGDGNDVISGGTANDVLYGENGKDRLFGNTGADTFVFADRETAAALNKADIIMHFAGARGDRIDLTAIDADENTNGDQQLDFIGRQAFSHTAGELRYEVHGKDIVLLGDTDGNARADFVIRLEGTDDLKAAYFEL